MPRGLQVVGRPDCESMLIALAEHFESEIGWHGPPVEAFFVLLIILTVQFFLGVSKAHEPMRVHSPLGYRRLCRSQSRPGWPSSIYAITFGPPGAGLVY